MEGTTAIKYVGGSLVKEVECIALKYGAKLARSQEVGPKAKFGRSNAGHNELKTTMKGATDCNKDGSFSLSCKERSSHRQREKIRS